MTVRVLIADDHAVVRGGLAQLISTTDDIEVVGLVADGQEAVSAASELSPDVILMDIGMPVLDGVAATRVIVNAHPQARVVVLTSFADDAHITDALKAGAIGYILKHAGPDELLGAIRAAAAGDAPLDPKAARVLLEGRRVGRSDQGLSQREREVLRLVMQGQANKQIARHLGITERTVKAHLTNVFSRLGVTDRTQAALWAAQHPDEVAAG